jgi:hypothetical protein
LLVDWQERVTVPHIDYPLEEAVMEHIQAQFDPLSGPRGEHGMLVICGLISFIDSL